MKIWTNEEPKYQAYLSIPISLGRYECFFDWYSMSLQSLELYNMDLTRSMSFYYYQSG